MGFRFRKSFKIAPGIKVNLSKKGASLSAGAKGFRVNSKGNASISKGGFGYQTNLFKNSTKGKKKEALGIWSIIIIFVLFGVLIKAFI